MKFIREGLNECGEGLLGEINLISGVVSGPLLVP